MPFRVGGRHAPASCHVLFLRCSPSWLTNGGTVGDKKNFVAHGHSLMFTSNGQTHHHWTPLEFRDRTKLNRIADHEVVKSRPTRFRRGQDRLLHRDRSGVGASEETLRIESSVPDFLTGWDELREINDTLILESIRSSRNEHPTLEISRLISRAYAARTNGFALRGGGRNGRRGYGQGEKLKPPPVLHADPTMLKGPEKVTALQGTSKTVRFAVDAKDEFFSSGTGEISVALCSSRHNSSRQRHRPCTRRRVRVIVTVPAEAQAGGFDLVASIREWERASGGIGVDLEWETGFQVVDESRRRHRGRREGRIKESLYRWPTGCPAVAWRQRDRADASHARQGGGSCGTAGR